MACCLAAWSHCLSQCWLLNSEVLWYLPQSYMIVITQTAILYDAIENVTFQLAATSPRGQWVKWQPIWKPSAPMIAVCSPDVDRGQLGAHLGPTGPRYAPCRPHELCYLAHHQVCVHWHLRGSPFYTRKSFLAHWGRDKMTAISQRTISNAFLWMKMFKFWLTFHWCLFLRLKLTTFQHWFRQWLGADQATSHYLNQSMMLSLRTHIYVSLGLNRFRVWKVPLLRVQIKSVLHREYH